MKNVFRQKEYRDLFMPLMVDQLFLMVIQNFNVLLFSMYNEKIVAATGITAQALSIGSMFLGMVSLGSSILFLRNADDAKQDYIQEVFQQNIILNVMISLFLSTISLLFGQQIITLMQTPNDIYQLTVIYLQIVSLGFIFEGISTSVSALLRSFSHVKTVMVLSVVQTVFTILANLFVFFILKDPEQGIVGIAIATVLSKLLSASLSLFLLKKHQAQVLSGIWRRRPRFEVAKEILSLGIPSGMENVSYNFSQTILTAIIASLGTAAINAKIYQQTITDFIFKIAVASGQTGQIKVSQLIRNEEEEESKNFGRSNSWSIFCLSIILGIIVVLLQPFFIPLFTSDVQTARILSALLFLDIIYNAFRSVNEVVIAQLNLVGEVKYPVFMGILVTYIFTIPFSYLSVKLLHYGLVAVWIVFIIDEGLRAYLFDRRWQNKSLLN